MLPSGSSPLARGLPVPSPRHPLPQRDHPRSRGVYPPPTVMRRTKPGSSPLARGLHKIEAALKAADRIIPARAGFTMSSTRAA